MEPAPAPVVVLSLEGSYVLGTHLCCLINVQNSVFRHRSSDFSRPGMEAVD